MNAPPAGSAITVPTVAKPRRPNTAPLKGRCAGGDFAGVVAPLGMPFARARQRAFGRRTTDSGLCVQDFFSYEPDSDMSEDDEAIELRDFWRRVKLDCARSLIPDAEAFQKPPGYTPECGFDSAKSACAGKEKSIICRSEAQERSTSITKSTTPIRTPARQKGSPAQRCPSPNVFRRRHHQRWADGARLWSWSTEMNYAVLSFLDADCVCELVCACATLRAAGSVNHAGSWRLLSPHLKLCTDNCTVRLDHVWLPSTMWLEAKGLNTQSSLQLFSAMTRPGLRAAHALLELDLTNTKISCPDNVVALARACAGLRSLNLSRTRLRDAGFNLVIHGLLSDPSTGVHNPHRSLRTLALEANFLTGDIGPMLGRAMLSMPLEALFLARNELGDQGAQAIAEALTHEEHRARNTQLLRLDVSENQLSAAGLAALLGALGSNRTLQSLSAGGNERIGGGLVACPDTAQEITAGLKAAMTLQDLHLWRCGMSDTACRVVVSARRPHLVLLNLAANPFSAELRSQLLHGSGTIHL